MDLTKTTNNISFTGQAREGERKEAGVRGREEKGATEQEGRGADEAEEVQREEGGQRRGWWGAESRQPDRQRRTPRTDTPRDRWTWRWSDASPHTH